MIRRGYIYESTNRENDPHYFISMEDEVDGKEMYRACIITHAADAENCEHIPMSVKHFKNKLLYHVKYDNKRGTYLVIAGFEKKVCNIVPRPVGELTQEGIKFVEQKMYGHEYSYFPKPISQYP